MLPFLGFGLYWAWVYLSFNSGQVVALSQGDDLAITWLHILSGLAGCATFLAAIVWHRRIERSRLTGAIAWTAAGAAAFGSMFYAVPLLENDTAALIVGAVVPGLATPLLALSWGVAYCRLDSRWAAGLTAGSFLLSGALYGAVSCIPSPLSGVVAAFLPLASALTLALLPEPARPRHEPAAAAALREFGELVSGPFSSRALLGILLTMTVSGGLRAYAAIGSPAIYHEPALVSLSTMATAAAFLAYSAFVPHTSLRLGPLYRIATPLFALGIVALTAFSTPDSAASYFAASAGSMFIDMVTWVLLIEIARPSRFSALLVFAVGRCAIHAGMAAGEAIALAAPSGEGAFCAAAVVVLLVVAGFMFSDRDKALVFEPVTAGELNLSEPAGTPDGEADDEGDQTARGGLDKRVAAVANACGLTARETEVFSLWASGHGAKSIEEKLVLSPATVRTHVRHIYEKCDVHSRAELIDLIERGAK